jgi:hypothetical protein
MLSSSPTGELDEVSVLWREGSTLDQSGARGKAEEWLVKSRETVNALRRTFPELEISAPADAIRLGEAIWFVLKDKKVHLPDDKSGLDVGRTWRSWGSLIACLIPGTDYMDFYLSDPAAELAEEALKRMVAAGWVLEEIM